MMKKFVTPLTKSNVKMWLEGNVRLSILRNQKENVQYEEITAVFTVQKCHKMKERVCDTVYETELTEKDDYKCITIVNPYCAKKDRTVYDKTCRTMVNFDCKAQGGNAYGGSSTSNGDAGYGAAP